MDPLGGVEALRRNDERLLAAIEVGRLGVWSWDLATGAVEWDQHMESRYGLQPGEFSGTFEEFVARIHPDDRDCVTQEITAARDQRRDLSFEHRVVQVLQETVTRPEFPPIEGYEVSARYLAAEHDTEIGGDWYDAFTQPDGRIVLAVGDVSGHGIRAARLMAKLRHATCAYACTESDLAVRWTSAWDRRTYLGRAPPHRARRMPTT